MEYIWVWTAGWTKQAIWKKNKSVKLEKMAVGMFVCNPVAFVESWNVMNNAKHDL